MERWLLPFPAKVSIIRWKKLVRPPVGQDGRVRWASRGLWALAGVAQGEAGGLWRSGAVWEGSAPWAPEQVPRRRLALSLAFSAFAVSSLGAYVQGLLAILRAHLSPAQASVPGPGSLVLRL